VELQRSLPQLERAGYALFAISYDRPADLRAFADGHGITYPLLGDEGSRVIRALGVLDEDLEAHHAVFGVPTRPEQQGVAYPMTFVLDERGRVARKIVEENYRVRSSSGWLVADVANAPADGSGPKLEATAGASMVTARMRLDASAYFAFQRLRLELEFRVPRNSGVVTLGIAIRFQTCSATECLPPSAIALSLAVPETPAL